MDFNSAGHPFTQIHCEQVDDASKQTRIQHELQEIIGGSSRQFAETLCNEYLKTNDYSSIYAAVTAVERLEARLRAVQPISQRGLGIQVGQGADLTQKMRLVTRILENLLLNAMEGNNISDLHNRGLLLYQSVADVC